MTQSSMTLPPDPARVMDGLRDTGYDFNTAIADIIDNSIAAKASNIEVNISMSPNQEIAVMISDNGIGMDELGLQNAMKYGSAERSDKGSLGKFGLGLKTASTAFCRRLSVISRTEEEMIARKYTWDLDVIAANKEWKLLIDEPSDEEIELLDNVAEGTSGTLVVWEKNDRVLRSYKREGDARNGLNKILNNLRFHTALVFERYLDCSNKDCENVSIAINGEEVAPWDPFCKSEEGTETLIESVVDVFIEGEEPSEAQLSIKAYVLPRKEEFSSPEAAKKAVLTNDLQGFYIYRENRLIHYGDWMGMFSREPHFTLLRVDLSFDHRLDTAFNVDIKKSRIQLNDEIYSYILKSMSAPRRAADERYREGRKKKTVEAGTNAHASAGKNIDEKAPSIEGSKVTVLDTETGDVEVKNKNGTFKSRITIHTSTEPDELRVVPVENINYDMLWEPCLSNNKKSVLINQGHPYYQKIYGPVLNHNSVMVTGMDALLWALAEAELSTFNDQTREQYEEMRIQVSRALKKLVADLPEPEYDGDRKDD